MKLFFLIGVFSLVCFGCGRSVQESQVKNEEAAAKNEETSKPSEGDTLKPVEMWTITHQADNDEDVLISYENPKNGKKISRFEMQSDQCFKFTKEQLGFIKSIKFGAGGIGLMEDNMADVYNVVCGSILAEDEEEEGHVDRLRPFVEPDDEARFPCSALSAHRYYVIEDEGAIVDHYVLKKSGQNLLGMCIAFEDIL